jgi:hypothetical protein
MASRASKRLDSRSRARLAISDEGMDLSIGDPEGGAEVVETSEARGVSADGALPVGFSPRAKVAQAQALALHSTRGWRRDDRQGNRLGSGA